MVPVLLILIPLISGLLGFFIKNDNAARSWSLFSSILTLIVAFTGIALHNGDAHLRFDAEWPFYS